MLKTIGEQYASPIVNIDMDDIDGEDSFPQ